MANLNEKIKKWFNNRFKEHFTQVYRAYVNDPYNELGTEPSEAAELSLDAVRVKREDRESLPKLVLQSYEFYWKHFEEADIGSARVYEVSAGDQETYVIRVKTDGDDGYLEVYSKKGDFLAAGRNYLEIIAWGEQDWLRAQTASPGDLPDELKNAPEETLWGKPLE